MSDYLPGLTTDSHGRAVARPYSARQTGTLERESERRNMVSVAIVTKYLGPTDYRGSRIAAFVPERIAACDNDGEADWNRPSYWRLTIPYPHELGPGAKAHQAAAMALARRLGWFGTWYAGALVTGYCFVMGDEPYAVTPE